MVVPAAKEKLMRETRHRVREFEQQYQEGITTDKENTTTLSMPGQCTDQVGIEMDARDPPSPRWTRSRPHAGAEFDLHDGELRRARSQQQMKQLAGMRGLMASRRRNHRGVSRSLLSCRSPTIRNQVAT